MTDLSNDGAFLKMPAKSGLHNNLRLVNLMGLFFHR